MAKRAIEELAAEDMQEILNTLPDFPNDDRHREEALKLLGEYLGLAMDAWHQTQGVPKRSPNGTRHVKRILDSSKKLKAAINCGESSLIENVRATYPSLSGKGQVLDAKRLVRRMQMDLAQMIILASLKHSRNIDPLRRSVSVLLTYWENMDQYAGRRLPVTLTPRSRCLRFVSTTLMKLDIAHSQSTLHKFKPYELLETL